MDRGTRVVKDFEGNSETAKLEAKTVLSKEKFRSLWRLGPSLKVKSEKPRIG